MKSRLTISVLCMIIATSHVCVAGEATPKAKAKVPGLTITIKQPKPTPLPAESFKKAKAIKELAAKASKLRAALMKLYKDKNRDRAAIAKVQKELSPIQRELMTLSRGTIETLDLTVVMENKSKNDITFNYGGDVTRWALKVEGKGAVDLPYRGPMTMEYRMGKPLTIKAGQSQEFVIAGLRYGSRNMSRWLLSEPGTYQISATFKGRAGKEKLELASALVKVLIAVREPSVK
jgi:hypothetical protein